MAVCDDSVRVPAAPRPALADGPGNTANTGRSDPSTQEASDRCAPNPRSAGEGRQGKEVRMLDKLDTLSKLTTDQLRERWMELGIRGNATAL